VGYAGAVDVPLEQTLKALRERLEGERRVADARAQAIRARLPAAAELLRARYGAGRVVLFGSLAHLRWIGPQSDVDLAVTGLDPRGIIDAGPEVEAILGADVDLLDLDEAPPSLRQRIATEGQPL
jgi:predicted nucleotidyltransferase